ncbi:MAG: hypothetical protein KKF44_06545 [Nanoarchaeota archaeon]|nr:hypothetical protein [Nanoarchaeota archaeon]
MIKDIIKLMEERRLNLINLFESEHHQIDASRQHQIYGAIAEIEFMLKTLRYHQDLNVRQNLSQREDNMLRLD